MRQFNRAFKRSRTTDKDAYYLFLVPGSGAARAGQSRRGFMPFKKQFGFIFTERVSDLPHTIAHELGHEAFRLRHPFDEFGLAKGTTDNLMDYNEGTKLYKYQWDNVHDPEAMVGWLQGDEESAYYTVEETQKLLEEVKKNNEGKRIRVVTSRAVVTTKDLSDEAWLATNVYEPASWLPDDLVTGLTTDETIRKRLEGKPEDYGTHLLHAVWVDPTTDKNAVLLAHEVAVVIEEQTIPVTIYGYAPTNQIFTHYVGQHSDSERTTFIFFNYTRPDRAQGRLKAGVTNVNNIRKAFSLTVDNRAFL